MESSKLLIRRTPDRDVLQPVVLGGDYKYLWILNPASKNVYAYDTSTAWPHTLTATISLASMTAVFGICYRAENDSIYVLGQLDIGIISNASNPWSSSLTRITGLLINGGGWGYDYRRDKLYNLDGNGAIKIIDPQTNTDIIPTGWSEGFGAGIIQYAGDIEKIVTCSASMLGLWDTVASAMIFGRVGSGITLGARDAAFYDGSLYVICASAVVKAQLQLTGELNFIASLSTTQPGRSICIDRVNNKLVSICNPDGAAQNIHYKFINPTALTINSSPTIAEVSDERQAQSIVWSPYNNKCYSVTRQITGGNPTRLIQVDAGTETIDNYMDLPANIGTGIASNNLTCFNGLEL